MNYEKLSHALHYYYAKIIIHKMHGKHYMDRFFGNLDSILGMTFREFKHKLKRVVKSSGKPINIKHQQNNFLQHHIFYPQSPSSMNIQNKTEPGTELEPFLVSPAVPPLLLLLLPVNVLYVYMWAFNSYLLLDFFFHDLLLPFFYFSLIYFLSGFTNKPSLYLS